MHPQSPRSFRTWHEHVTVPRCGFQGSFHEAVVSIGNSMLEARLKAVSKPGGRIHATHRLATRRQVRRGQHAPQSGLGRGSASFRVRCPPSGTGAPALSGWLRVVTAVQIRSDQLSCFCPKCTCGCHRGLLRVEYLNWYAHSMKEGETSCGAMAVHHP